MGPLSGIRVIDMTTVLMGPSATQLLGDMGADVIKVEAPEGDLVRQIAPARHDGMGALFLNANRSKRSICLNLKHEGGRAALLALARGADALIYNVRPQAMARLGLDYEAVRAAKPSIVYAGLYGFGQDGPYAAKPAYDDLIQGASGLASLFARGTGDEPRYVPQAVSDRVVGLAAFGAICAALVHQARTGEGQRVDVPMFETMAGFVMADHAGGLTFDPPLGEAGYPRQLSPLRKPYRTLDGHVCALVYTDTQWQRFLAAVGREELLDDPRYATFPMRAANIDVVYATFEEIVAGRTTQDWLALFDEIDIPSAPLHTLESIADDPHLRATGFFETVEHPSEGTVRMMKQPSTFSATPSAPERLAPRQGEHGAEILAEAGFDETAIADLAASGAYLPG
ncbi:MAG TPA: CoA transferase [Chakrabartia sp.]|nr:CoA transferase [Chakrabartia sp.]